jgi:hypothetical protein
MNTVSDTTTICYQPRIITMNSSGGRSGQFFNQGGGNNGGGYSSSQPGGFFSHGDASARGGGGSGGGVHPPVGQSQGYQGQVGDALRGSSGGGTGGGGGSYPTISQPEGYIHLSANRFESQTQATQPAVNWDALVDQVFREEIRDWALSAQEQQESGRRKTV